MTDTITGAQSPELGHMGIEPALARYPDIGPDEVHRLIHWFRKEASAHDVALIASNEDIHEQYRLFRKNHIDLFTIKDGLVILAFLLVAIGIIAGIMLLTPA